MRREAMWEGGWGEQGEKERQYNPHCLVKKKGKKKMINVRQEVKFCDAVAMGMLNVIITIKNRQLSPFLYLLNS